MFVLPIKSTYVPRWGTFECLREILQNAKDEEEEHGHKMTVRYHHGWLRVSNLGANLTRKALLIGETSKADRPDLRGQFGEGLDLALLSGVRAGYEIRVFTRTEVWTPTLEYVEKFDATVLVVRTRAATIEAPGVEVRIKMPIADWKEARKLFRFLVDDEDEFKVSVDKGTILLHPDRRGQIYVKGIYTTTIKNLAYGYDLKTVQLDRDRRMVDIWDLRWELAGMLRDAVSRDPEKLAPAVYAMLKDRTEEVQSLGGYGNTEAFASKMAEYFHSEYGTEAVPVESMADSQQLDHLGAKGVVVSDTLRRVLDKKVKSASDIQRDLATAVTREWSWHELENDERDMLSLMVGRVALATTDYRSTFHVRPLLERLQVVDFRRADLYGTCDLSTKVVKIARRVLTFSHEALITLVHEEAHALSSASDGAKSHLDMIERIWSQLYHSKS